MIEKKKSQSAVMASHVLSPLSHPTRLLIVCLLLERERYVLELLEQLGTTKGNISQHLTVLTSKKLLKKRKEANRIYYSIADERLHTLVKTIQSLYCPALGLT